MAEYKDLKYNEEIGPVKSAEADNLQKALSSMGYYTTKEDGTPLSFDGAFGKYTSAAVSDFAKDYGINYTGTVSSDLYNAILTEANNRKNGKTSTTVGEQTGYNALYKNAQDYKKSAYENALNQQSASYRAAMEARQEAEALAEIQRKRGVVDASTMAEQQKATYGANAEQVGRMGLQVSGYSDYLNSQAYAAGMAGRQAANAQATDIKRQALYQEAIARLDADKAYSQATAEADKTYYSLMNDIGAARIEDEKEKEQQEKTNYMNFINSISPDATPEKIESIASFYGITDKGQIDKAKEYVKTMYGDSTTPSTENGDTEAFNNVFYNISGEGENATAEPKTPSEAKVAFDKEKIRYEAGEILEDEWRTIEATYEMEYGNGNIVSIYSKTFDENSFGKFKKGDEQKDLTSAIVLMAEGELMTSDGTPLEANDCILVNYGSGTKTYFKYNGNGVFEKTKVSESEKDKIVVPEGYYLNEYGRIHKGLGYVEVTTNTTINDFVGASGEGKVNKESFEKINSGKVRKGEYVTFIKNSHPICYLYQGNGRYIQVLGTDVPKKS